MEYRIMCVRCGEYFSRRESFKTDSVYCNNCRTRPVAIPPPTKTKSPAKKVRIEEVDEEPAQVIAPPDSTKPAARKRVVFPTITDAQ